MDSSVNGVLSRSTNERRKYCEDLVKLGRMVSDMAYKPCNVKAHLPPEDDRNPFPVTPPFEKYLKPESSIYERKRRFFLMAEPYDVVIGRYVRTADSYHELQILCFFSGKYPVIDDLDIMMYIDAEEISLPEHGALVRGCIIGVNLVERITFLSTNKSCLPDSVKERLRDTKLGVITENELPMHYRFLQRVPLEPFHTYLPDMHFSLDKVDGMVTSFGLSPKWSPRCSCRDLTPSEYAAAIRKERNEELSRYHCNKGMHHYTCKKYAEAGIEFNQALTFNPDNPDALFHLGSLCLTLKKYDDAIRRFDSCLSKDPYNENAKHFLARALSIRIKNSKSDVEVLKYCHRLFQLKDDEETCNTIIEKYAETFMKIISLPMWCTLLEEDDVSNIVNETRDAIEPDLSQRHESDMELDSSLECEEEEKQTSRPEVEVGKRVEKTAVKAQPSTSKKDSSSETGAPSVEEISDSTFDSEDFERKHERHHDPDKTRPQGRDHKHSRSSSHRRKHSRSYRHHDKQHRHSSHKPSYPSSHSRQRSLTERWRSSSTSSRPEGRAAVGSSSEESDGAPRRRSTSRDRRAPKTDKAHRDHRSSGSHQKWKLGHSSGLDMVMESYKDLDRPAKRPCGSAGDHVDPLVPVSSYPPHAKEKPLSILDDLVELIDAEKNRPRRRSGSNSST